MRKERRKEHNENMKKTQTKREREREKKKINYKNRTVMVAEKKEVRKNDKQ